MRFKSSFHNYGRRHVSVLFGGDSSPHYVDEFLSKERVPFRLRDSERFAPDDLDLCEMDPLQFLDEVTLRQGSGHSPSPCRGMS